MPSQHSSNTHDDIRRNCIDPTLNRACFDVQCITQIIFFAACDRVCTCMKCIWPDPVEYVPAMQKLQSAEPAREESLRHNQSTEVTVHDYVCCRVNMHKPSPQRIAQQWPTCPGLIGSSLAEVARAGRHSACTIQSERTRDSMWWAPRRSDGVEQARHGLRARRSNLRRE